MFKRLIRSVRRQPKPVRDKVALGIAGTVTACIFVVWLYHLPARHAAIAEQRESDGEASFSELFSKIGDEVKAVRESLPQVDEEQVAAAGSSTTAQQSVFVATSSDDSWNIWATTTTSATVGTTTVTRPDLRPPVTEPAIRIVAVPSTSTATSGPEGQ